MTQTFSKCQTFYMCQTFPKWQTFCNCHTFSKCQTFSKKVRHLVVLSLDFFEKNLFSKKIEFQT